MVYELPNDLRLRILGNQEILGKSQIWVQTSRIKTLVIAVKKHAKVDINTFLVLSSFTEFLYFVLREKDTERERERERGRERVDHLWHR